jgi:DNA-directed RNA polymerase subunit RPC12/RpoP
VPKTIKECRCSSCGAKWPIEITSEESPDGKRTDSSTECPSCGHSSLLLAMPEQRIVAVKPLPK